MASASKVAEVAAMMGDPTRASMLLALGDGRALPAGELAAIAHVTPQTASGHLSQLVRAGLLSVIQQGRHRYFRVASDDVGALLEAVMVVASPPAKPRRVASKLDAALREARTCYHHLAGRLGVAILDGLTASGHVRLGDESCEITPSGLDFFTGLGMDTASWRLRPWCKVCQVDWSERRPHLGGRLGSDVRHHCETQGWIRRRRDDRAVDVTPAGRLALRATFGVTLGD